MSTLTSRSTDRLAERWRPNAWLAVAIGAAGLVSAVYVTTHGHPAYEGGLYLQFVEEILANGYGLPARIPHYTAEGVPFAYPPLLFYVVAVVVDLTGADPVWLMRVVPGVVVVLYLLPFYAVARDCLGSVRQAGFATLLFAVTPPVLQWHISAGGLIRAPAMLLALCGIFTGLRLFRTGDRRWVLSTAVLWGLTVLSHPVYAAFLGWSLLLGFAVFDRSRAGLVNGVVVCAGGLLLAAPWWLQVASIHGPDVFLTATGSRTSLGGGAWRLLTQFVHPITATNALTPFFVAAYAGGIYWLLRGRYFLPLWMASAAYLLGTARFTFVAGSMLAAALVFEVVAHRIGAGSVPVRRRTAILGVVVLLGVGAAGVGVAYSASALLTAHEDSPSQPQTVHPSDIDAMAWAGQQTGPDADFLVVGDAAEWFPYYAERTILVSPWGTEWTTADRFWGQVALHRQVSTCDSVACLESTYAEVGQAPDYVYVPARAYTVRGDHYDRPDRLIGSLLASDRYHLRFADEGVLIFEVERSEIATSAGPVAASDYPPRLVRSSRGLLASRNAP